VGRLSAGTAASIKTAGGAHTLSDLQKVQATAVAVASGSHCNGLGLWCSDRGPDTDPVGVAFPGGRGHKNKVRRNQRCQPWHRSTRDAQCSTRIKHETDRHLSLRWAGREVRRQCSTH
jgi:hypothetical protein